MHKAWGSLALKASIKSNRNTFLPIPFTLATYSHLVFLLLSVEEGKSQLYIGTEVQRLISIYTK